MLRCNHLLGSSNGREVSSVANPEGVPVSIPWSRGYLNRCRGLEVTGEAANHNSKVVYSWWAPDPRLASNSLCS